MIILSVSSSISFSILLISADTSGTFFTSSAIFSSFSRSLTAKNRFCSSGISSVSLPSMDSSTFSTSAANRCVLCGGAPLSASAAARSAACKTPSPFRAEISTTSQPSFSLSFTVSILSPLFATISIILTAITTGIPSSNSCVDRYRFLSMLVPSTILMIASGLSAIR